MQRLPAKELLKLKFIRSAKKSTLLLELIERKNNFLLEKYKRHTSEQSAASYTNTNNFLTGKTDASGWEFDTVKPNGMLKNLQQDETIQAKFNTIRMKRIPSGPAGHNLAGAAVQELQVSKRRISQRAALSDPPDVLDRHQILSQLDLNNAPSTQNTAMMESIGADNNTFESDAYGPAERHSNRTSLDASVKPIQRHSAHLSQEHLFTPSSSPRVLHTPHGLQDLVITDDDDDEIGFVREDVNNDQVSEATESMSQQQLNSLRTPKHEEDVFADYNSDSDLDSKAESVGVFQGLILPALYELERRSRTEKTRAVVRRLKNAIQAAEIEEPGIGETLVEELYRGLRSVNII